MSEDATEEKAKNISANTSYIHFACHGFVDEQVPLDSALVLALTAKEHERGENGILQAWEIFESVRIDADLVVMSACETGLGKAMRGEGMIGLTRAFQYAGARSIIASSWKVSDRSTSELMKFFYGNLKKGLPKDIALQKAKKKLLKRKKYSHPFYWAGFQLIGDWK